MAFTVRTRRAICRHRCTAAGMNPPLRTKVTFVDPPRDVAETIERRASPSAFGTILGLAARNPHAFATLVLAIALVPALGSVHQPLRFEWHTLVLAYWASLAFQSIFAAALFCILALPAEATRQPLLHRYPLDKRRILLLIPFLLLL